MPSFIQGVESGKGVSSPFGILLREIGKSEQRRLDEDTKRRSEERQLKRAIELLGEQTEKQKEVESFKSDLKIKEKGVPLTQDSSTDGQGLLKSVGLAPNNRVATTSAGEQVLIPESPTETKTRLQIEKLSRELDPEFQKQEFVTKLEQQEKLDELSVKKSLEQQKGINRENAKVQMDEINKMVDSIWQDADRLIPASESGREAVFTGAERGFKATALGRLLAPSDEGEDVRAFVEARKAIATPLIRALGEKGMLTNQDIQRSLNLLPTPGDSTRQRNEKRNILSRFLQSKVQAHFETIEFEQEAIASEKVDQPKTTKSGNSFRIISK